MLLFGETDLDVGLLLMLAILTAGRALSVLLLSSTPRAFLFMTIGGECVDGSGFLRVNVIADVK